MDIKSKFFRSVIEINPSTEYSTIPYNNFCDSLNSNLSKIIKSTFDNLDNFNEIKLNRNKIKKKRSKKPTKKTKLSISTRNINNLRTFLNDYRLSNNNEQNHKELNDKKKLNSKIDNNISNNKQIINKNKSNNKFKDIKRSVKALAKKNNYTKNTNSNDKFYNKKLNDEKLSDEYKKLICAEKLIENKQNQYIKKSLKMLNISRKNIMSKSIKKNQYLESQGCRLDNKLKNSFKINEKNIKSDKKLETPLKNNNQKNRVISKKLIRCHKNCSTLTNTIKKPLANNSNDFQRYRTIKYITGYFCNSNELKTINKYNGTFNNIRKPKVNSMEYISKINNELDRNKFSNLFFSNENFKENYLNDFNSKSSSTSSSGFDIYLKKNKRRKSDILQYIKNSKKKSKFMKKMMLQKKESEKLKKFLAFVELQKSIKENIKIKKHSNEKNDQRNTILLKQNQSTTKNSINSSSISSSLNANDFYINCYDINRLYTSQSSLLDKLNLKFNKSNLNSVNYFNNKIHKLDYNNKKKLRIGDNYCNNNDDYLVYNNFQKKNKNKNIGIKDNKSNINISEKEYIKIKKILSRLNFFIDKSMEETSNIKINRKNNKKMKNLKIIEKIANFKKIFENLLHRLQFLIKKIIFFNIIKYGELKFRYKIGLEQLVLLFKCRPFNELRLIQQKEYYNVILKQFYLPFIIRAFNKIKNFVIKQKTFIKASKIINHFIKKYVINQFLVFIENKEKSSKKESTDLKENVENKEKKEDITETSKKVMEKYNIKIKSMIDYFCYPLKKYAFVFLFNYSLKNNNKSGGSIIILNEENNTSDSQVIKKNLKQYNLSSNEILMDIKNSFSQSQNSNIKNNNENRKFNNESPFIESKLEEKIIDNIFFDKNKEQLELFTPLMNKNNNKNWQKNNVNKNNCYIKYNRNDYLNFCFDGGTNDSNEKNKLNNNKLDEEEDDDDSINYNFPQQNEESLKSENIIKNNSDLTPPSFDETTSLPLNKNDFNILNNEHEKSNNRCDRNKINFNYLTDEDKINENNNQEINIIDNTIEENEKGFNNEYNKYKIQNKYIDDNKIDEKEEENEEEYEEKEKKEGESFIRTKKNNKSF